MGFLRKDDKNDSATSRYDAHLAELLRLHDEMVKSPVFSVGVALGFLQTGQRATFVLSREGQWLWVKNTDTRR